jgi:hypothetical protein
LKRGETENAIVILADKLHIKMQVGVDLDANMWERRDGTM